MILSMVEQFANVKHFCFYIRQSSGNLIWDVVSSVVFLDFRIKRKKKMIKLLAFYVRL